MLRPDDPIRAGGGLTVREEFAARALAALITGQPSIDGLYAAAMAKRARVAVEYAEALILALNQSEGG
jgi:hypothetical protein